MAWEADVVNLSLPIWSSYKALSGIVKASEQQSMPGQDLVDLKAVFHSGAIPKPSLSLPIGLYDYFPTLGFFSPGHVNVRDINTQKRRGDLKRVLSEPPHITALSVWGISHLTNDRSLYGALGIIVEKILAGIPRKEVEGNLADLVAGITGSKLPVVKPKRVFDYPPFIQVVFESLTRQAAANMKDVLAPAKIDSAGLLEDLKHFFYNPNSPLYRGIEIHSVKSPPGSGVDYPYAMNMWSDPMVMKERMDAAGQQASDGFDPAIVTALIQNNSKQKIDQAKAVALNAVEVMARDPQATYFDKTQDFPFDISGTDRDEMVNSILTAENLAEGHGKILVSQMSKKAVRSEAFAKAMVDITTPVTTPPPIRRIDTILRRIAKSLLKSGL